MLLWTHVYKYLFKTLLASLSGIFPKVELLNHTVILFLIFWRTTIPYSTPAVHYIPTNRAHDFQFPHQYLSFSNFDSSRLKGCEVVSHCTFDLYFPNDSWSRAKANIEFCQENIVNTLFQQHKTRLYTGTSPHGQHQNQIDYILCSQRWRSSIQSAKTRLGADCGSDQELLIAKFRLKLKKVGKTTRPFR